MEAGARSPIRPRPRGVWPLAPILLLALVVGAFVSGGSSVVDLIGHEPASAPTSSTSRRVEFQPGEIRIRVRNPQVEELTIASVTVDDAIVPFTLDGPATLKRLRSSTIVVPYDWVEGDPITVGVTSSTGIETVSEIPAAIETPSASAQGFFGRGDRLPRRHRPGSARPALAALPPTSRSEVARGLHGVDGRAPVVSRSRVPVRGVHASGPAARRARRAGLVLLGVALSALGMTFLSSRLARGGAVACGLGLALLVAIGIGVHNLGEGLAIGSSFAFGELHSESFLVVGFMIHNVTEGLAIAAPATEAAASASHSFWASRWSPAARRSSARGSVATRRATSSACSSSVLRPGAALQVVVEVGRFVARARRGASAPGGSSAATSPGSSSCISPGSSSVELRSGQDGPIGRNP